MFEYIVIIQSEKLVYVIFMIFMIFYLIEFNLLNPMTDTDLTSNVLLIFKVLINQFVALTLI